MNTITLNEALKQRVYDSVAISEITASSLNADTVDADTVTTAPETIHLGAVDLGDNFPKYLTIADPNGGLQAAAIAYAKAGKSRKKRKWV